MKKILSVVFYCLFAVSVLLTTVFFVPKYYQYWDGGVEAYSATGYCGLFKTSTEPAFRGNYNHITGEALLIDYKQWGIILLVECVVFLVPAIVLHKATKK